MAERTELIYFPTWTAGRKGYAERVRQVFGEHLKKKGLFHTPQRLAILNFLLQADRHLNQEDIYQALKSKGIGKITVFRALKMLEESHLIEKVSSPDGKSRYEVQMERPHHDHLICVDCGHITEVRWPDVEHAQEKACRKLGFEVLWHRHELFGRCAECRAGRKPTNGAKPA